MQNYENSIVQKQPKKKVWHLLSNRWNSAITEYALSSALALERHSSWSGVFSPLGDSPAESRSRGYGLETRPLLGFSLLQLPRFLGMAAAIQPDVIIAYGGPEASLARLLPKHLRCPVLRFRGVPLQNRFKNLPRLFALGHRHLQGVFTPNTAISAQLRTADSELAVHTITLGLDETKFIYDGELIRRPELLLVGRFDPVKGHAEFFRIFSACIKSWDFPLGNEISPHLHIVGEPANISSEQIRAELKACGLREGIEVTLSDRRVDDLPALMEAATLGVISSLGSEYICRVAEEFLLCGTPLFISGAGATKEVLFTGAGACYEGKSIEEAGEMLKRSFVAAWEESESARSERAGIAGARYSLQSMASALLQIIGR
jgi:glycosyltransferase involved in cell wall biosynthesis